MAVDATGTPTTNYSIPKFNTAVDAPSGKGGNAQADYIDNLLKTGFAEKPAGIADGEVPVWDAGTSTWQRSSVKKITPSSLTGLSAMDNTYVISAANTDFVFSSSAPEALIGVTATGTAGTLRSIGAGAFDGQILRIRHLGTTGTKFTAKNSLAGGSGKQLSLFADRVLMTGDVLTVQWQGSLFSGAGGWYEINFFEQPSVGQWSGNTSQVNITWTDHTGVTTNVESLVDPNGSYGVSSGAITVAKSGTYAVSFTASIPTPGTASAAAITLNAFQYATDALYGTFGMVTTYLTQTMGAGTVIRGQSWTNGGAQSVAGRLTVKYLGAA